MTKRIPILLMILFALFGATFARAGASVTVMHEPVKRESQQPATVVKQVVPSGSEVVDTSTGGNMRGNRLSAGKPSGVDAAISTQPNPEPPAAQPAPVDPPKQQDGYQQYCADGIQAQGSCETPIGSK